MALFNKKTEEVQPESSEQKAKRVSAVKGKNILVVPRISEKAGLLNKINKYVFKVTGKTNKLEVKKAIEKQYSVTVVGINIITVNGKSRNFGRTKGTTSPFKKAIVTLKAGQTIEAAKES